MLMSWIWTLLLFCAIVSALLTGNGSALAAAIPQGAREGITFCICLGGSLCLWSGVGRVLEGAGITKGLSCLLRPILGKLFPTSRTDPVLADCLSGNLCANLLGLGNAATPMGVRAARCLAKTGRQGVASDELCKLVVLNTASLQLIPTSVAALRGALGSAAPFSILPGVWLTSLCSAAVGLGCAALLGRVWPGD